MEEDSAKMNHQGAESLAGSTHSLVDFNRAGTPLAEIVSEPDMRAGIEAAEYGRELQRVRGSGYIAYILSNLFRYSSSSLVTTEMASLELLFSRCLSGRLEYGMHVDTRVC